MNKWIGEVGRKQDPEEDDMIYNPYTGSFFRR